ncbi:hypothetical protein [Melissococcus sp. OM08-11BH]|uniref:hypothetical protein n=1 Tax=Melissococcus sp. OM08-11BH TaxID=2293110 RepID=UPI000E54B006|nr:hypothetical protein [Melissococcus sp. OM08-11BH]RGI32424.1 hypothetical protein DXC12_03745 [Melissococcus sp. OM08-11BH]
MEQSRVAGTVILNQQDGHKKFLVQKDQETVSFIQTTIDTNYTSLACILDKLTQSVGLNSDAMDLVELTNINIEDEKLPLFVFSLDEENIETRALNSEFFWEEPSTLRMVLQHFNVSGVPFLN